MPRGRRIARTRLRLSRVAGLIARGRPGLVPACGPDAVLLHELALRPFRFHLAPRASVSHLAVWRCECRHDKAACVRQWSNPASARNTNYSKYQKLRIARPDSGARCARQFADPSRNATGSRPVGRCRGHCSQCRCRVGGFLGGGRQPNADRMGKGSGDWVSSAAASWSTTGEVWIPTPQIRRARKHPLGCHHIRSGAPGPVQRCATRPSFRPR